jgi:hypothetical protein
VGGLAIVTALFIPSIAVASEVGRCVTADIPSDIVLPDGSLHAAGPLRICLSVDYNPVSGLHKTYVDGKLQGLFVSRRIESEDVDSRQDPYIQFHRMPSGELFLRGYGIPIGTRLMTYRMRPMKQRKNLPEQDRFAIAPGTELEPVIFVANLNR